MGQQPREAPNGHGEAQGLRLPALGTPALLPPVCSPHEAPPIPEAPACDSSDGEDELLEPFAEDGAKLRTCLPEEGASAAPEMLEVSGSCARRGYPALSPRSGLLKRKEGDHLRLNGMYALLPTLHNGTLCWAKLPDTGEGSMGLAGNDSVVGSYGSEESSGDERVLFRSADGASWVLDDRLHGGGLDELVLARLWTRANDPTQAQEEWNPSPWLRVCAASVDTVSSSTLAPEGAASSVASSSPVAP